jgi:membrane-bound serine protease (ClpP class)
MLLKIFLFIVLAFLLFEFVEHVVIPLLAIILRKKRKPVTGSSGLIGEICEVKEWSHKEGRVFIHGELWWATSEDPLSPGDKAVVQNVQGLTLTVGPHTKTNL